jgi:hypothetical protein
MLGEALRRSVAAAGFSHSELLREQIEAAAGQDQPAALLCLRLAEAVGGKADAALPAATSLALLSLMGRVLVGLEAQGGGASLSTAWGMPRSLNAGDAFYALAQDVLLRNEGGMPAERRLLEVDTLDEASRAYAEALQAAPEGMQLEAGEQALRSAAAALAGIVCGTDGDTMTRLRGIALNAGSQSGGDLEAALAELAKLQAMKRGTVLRKT